MKDKNPHRDLDKEMKELFINKEETHLRDKWAKVLAEEYNISKETSQTKTIPFFSTRLMVAASILIGLGFLASLFMLKSTGSQNLGNEELAKIQIISSSEYGHRGNVKNPQANTEARIAYEAMSNNEFEKAVEYYTKLQQIQPLDDYETYHLALSYAKKQEFSKVIPLLENLISKGQKYKQESRWLLSLSYLSNGNKEKAKKRLLEIVNNKSYKFEKAKLILNKLK